MYSARTSVILFIFQACAFLVVRSHIQTHEQNIQFGSQTEAGKMMVLCRHEPIIHRTTLLKIFLRNTYFAIDHNTNALIV